ncbi:MAG: hypothetical protein RMA76_16800 [Deltaproteobacteria bacterium]
MHLGVGEAQQTWERLQDAACDEKESDRRSVGLRDLDDDADLAVRELRLFGAKVAERALEPEAVAHRVEHLRARHDGEHAEHPAELRQLERGAPALFEGDLPRGCDRHTVVEHTGFLPAESLRAVEEVLIALEDGGLGAEQQLPAHEERFERLAGDLLASVVDRDLRPHLVSDVGRPATKFSGRAIRRASPTPARWRCGADRGVAQ